jgi:ketosteroid isomerase-like protein
VPFVLEQIAPSVEWIETEAENIPTHGRFSTPHVFTFRDGKVSRNDNFHDTALWAAALG